MNKFIVNENNYIDIINKINNFFIGVNIRKCCGIKMFETGEVETFNVGTEIFSKPIYEKRVYWSPFFGKAEVHYMWENEMWGRRPNIPLISVGCKFESNVIPLRVWDFVIFRDDKIFLIQNPDECINKFCSFSFKINRYSQNEACEYMKNQMIKHIFDEVFYFEDEDFYNKRRLVYDILDKISLYVNKIDFTKDIECYSIWLNDTNHLKIKIDIEDFKNNGLSDHYITFELNDEEFKYLPDLLSKYFYSLSNF